MFIKKYKEAICCRCGWKDWLQICRGNPLVFIKKYKEAICCRCGWKDWHLPFIILFLLSTPAFSLRTLLNSFLVHVSGCSPCVSCPTLPNTLLCFTKKLLPLPLLSEEVATGYMWWLATIEVCKLRMQIGSGSQG